jgi:hypothetical protein
MASRQPLVGRHGNGERPDEAALAAEAVAAKRVDTAQ